MATDEVFVVTGASGFIGSALVALLLDQHADAEVYGVDIAFTGQLAQNDHNEHWHAVQAPTWDLAEIWESRNYPSPTVVVHLGEYSRINNSFAEIEDVWQANCYGTKRVLDFTCAHGAFFIYGASTSEWGDHGVLGSPYTFYKAQNAALTRAYSAWFGLRFSLAYFSCVYGPGEHEEGSGASVVGIFNKAARERRPLPVVMPGSQRRRFTHVVDTIAGVLLLIERQESELICAFVGSDQYSIEELAALYDLPVIRQVHRRGDRNETFIPDEYVANAHQLGWVAHHDLLSYVQSLSH